MNGFIVIDSGIVPEPTDPKTRGLMSSQKMQTTKVIKSNFNDMVSGIAPTGKTYHSLYQPNIKFKNILVAQQNLWDQYELGMVVISSAYSVHGQHHHSEDGYIKTLVTKASEANDKAVESIEKQERRK